MKVKFFADDHNARFVWGWVKGAYTTEDPDEIENLTEIGLRFEVIDNISVQVTNAKEVLTEAIKTAAVEEKKQVDKRKKPKAKKKAKGQKKGLNSTG